MSAMTPEVVRGLEAHLCRTFDVVVHEKDDDALMWIVAQGLDVAGVLDAQRFRTAFATTIGTSIWIPRMYAASQLPFPRARLLVHETTHAVRYRRDPVRFASLYIRHGEDRAHEEALAYLAGAEFEAAVSGTVPALDTIGASLTGGGCTSCAGAYGLDPRTREFARGLIAQGAAALAAGARTSEVAVAAVAWLRAEHPEALA